MSHIIAPSVKPKDEQYLTNINQAGKNHANLSTNT